MITVRAFLTTTEDRVLADAARHSVSVAAVVVDDQDRALLIRRRDNGYWEPPGGGCDKASLALAGVSARGRYRLDWAPARARMGAGKPGPGPSQWRY